MFARPDHQSRSHNVPETKGHSEIAHRRKWIVACLAIGFASCTIAQIFVLPLVTPFLPSIVIAQTQPIVQVNPISARPAVAIPRTRTSTHSESLDFEMTDWQDELTHDVDDIVYFPSSRNESRKPGADRHANLHTAYLNSTSRASDRLDSDRLDSDFEESERTTAYLKSRAAQFKRWNSKSHSPVGSIQRAAFQTVAFQAVEDDLSQAAPDTRGAVDAAPDLDAQSQPDLADPGPPPAPNPPAGSANQFPDPQFSNPQSSGRPFPGSQFPGRQFPGGKIPGQHPAGQFLPGSNLPGVNAQPSIDNQRRYSVSFQAVPWDWALRKLAEESQLSLQMKQIPPGTFTCFDENRYTLLDLLDLVNDHLLPAGFLAIQNGRNLIVVETKSGIPENLVPHVSVHDLSRLGRNEIASVAIPVQSGLPSAAAQEIEKLLSPLGQTSPLNSSQRILVVDIGANLRRIHQLLVLDSESGDGDFSFVLKLRNTPAEEVAKAINDFLSSKAQGAAGPGNGVGHHVPRGNGSQSPEDSSPGGQNVVAERTTNSLLIRGSRQQISSIRRLVDRLDQNPSQVVIQALLVEVELGDTDEFGAEVGIQDSVLFDRSVIDKIVTLSETFTNPNGVQTTNQQVISQTAIPGFNFNNQPLGNNTAVRPSIVGKQGLTSLGVGRVNGDLGFGGLVLSAGSESISVLLRALRQNYQVDILSRPQIRALDNHEALIQIGRQVPVVDGVAITAVGSANPVIRQDQSGIILKVIPQISADGNVLIDVKAEKSAYQLTPGTGVPIFTDATNGNVIEAPVKDITTATTAVSVRTGETIVLGGMITRDEVRLHRKVPFLGDIPLLGQLFQYKLNESKRKELLIFLTPLVIEDSYHAERIKAVEVERMHFPMPMAEEMHGPIFADVMPVEHVEDPSMAPAYPVETGGYAAPHSAPGGTVYGPRYGTVPQAPGPGYSAPAGVGNATPLSSPPAETPRPRRKFLGGWAPSARRQR